MTNMTETAKKVLVVVASKHGSTLEIARVIAEEIRNCGLKVDFWDLNKGEEKAELADYDAVILGSGIYAGNWLHEAKAFAERHQAILSITPLWLFSSGPLGEGEPKPQHDPAQLKTSVSDLFVQDHQVFVGKLDPATLSFGEKLVVKMVKAPTGDFREWEKVQAWSREIAGKLGANSNPFVEAGDSR